MNTGGLWRSFGVPYGEAVIIFIYKYLAVVGKVDIGNKVGYKLVRNKKIILVLKGKSIWFRYVVFHCSSGGIAENRNRSG